MTLHYFTDPLCGWCYGFGPTIQNFYNSHSDEMDLEIVLGGMVKGEQEKPIGDMAPYLKEAYRRVEEVTAVTFGKAFLETLEDGTTFYSSIPSSIAFVVFKSYQNGKNLEYFSALQKAIYFDGVDPSNYEHFAMLASNFGIDQKDFIEKMNIDAFKKEAYDDFSVTQQFGVTGYPTLILHARDEYFLLAKGYSNLEKMEKTFQSIMHSLK